MAVAQHPWYFETDTPQNALAGRHLLERYLADHCIDTDFFAASLVFGELISNVIKHAPGGGVRVWLETAGKHFILCIYDSGKGFGDRDASKQPDDRAESGRGLFIVNQVSPALSYHRVEPKGFMVRAVLPVTRRIPA